MVSRRRRRSGQGKAAATRLEMRKDLRFAAARGTSAPLHETRDRLNRTKLLPRQYLKHERGTQRYIHFMRKDKRETANSIPFRF